MSSFGVVCVCVWCVHSVYVCVCSVCGVYVWCVCVCVSGVGKHIKIGGR